MTYSKEKWWLVVKLRKNLTQKISTSFTRFFCLSNLDISIDQTTKVIPYNSKISRINKCMKKLVNLLLYFERTDRKS